MVKKDKPATDKPAEEPKVEEPKTEEPKAEEPKVEKLKAKKPVSSPAAPAGDIAASAGTDQYGRQIYSVKCAACGKQAQVPFKPSGDRPVYCRDCYMKQRRGETGRGMDRRPRR